MTRRDFTALKPKSGAGHGLTVAVLLLALAVAGVGWRWWQVRQPPSPAGSVAVAPLESADEIESSNAAPGAVEQQTIEPEAPRYPLASVAADATSRAPLANADARLGSALTELLGQQGVAQFLQIDDLARRAVAMVDNLTQAEAPGGRWPVQPAPGRFSAAGAGDDRVIDPSNSARYAPLVQFAESVDTARIAALYREHYLLFQRAYEELGYPKRYFNDRLVGVIDHLLETPEPSVPPRVTQFEIRGPYKDPRPWTRYEFADPQLQALSAGQKLLVRMGPDNERRLKAKLRELRAAVTAGATARR